MRTSAAQLLAENAGTGDAELFFARALLDRLPGAIVVVGPTSNVVFFNRNASALISASDGLRLRAHGHPRLVFADKMQQHLFDRLVAQACSREAARTTSGLHVARPSGKPGYVVQVSSLGRLAAHDGRAAVFITDPCEHYTLDGPLLESVYELTGAELRVAEGMLGDKSLGEIAAMLRVKKSTARTQLSSLFRKTRTSRQAQLVKLLMALRS